MNINRFLISLLVLVSLAGCAPQREMQLIQAEQRSITVVGVGEIKASPDVAQIIFSIRIKGQDLMTAKGKNQEITSRARAELKKLSIKESDIANEYLHMYTENMFAPNSYPPAYIAQTAMRVTVYDLSKIEDILTSVLAAGATNVQGVYFQVSDLEFYREQARSMALEAANVKAATLADQLGQKVGEPISIYEAQTYPTSYSAFNAVLTTTTYDTGYINLWNNDSGIMFGEITVRTTMTVEFSLQE